MSIQQTLSIIKPDATKRNITGKIISKLEEAGLRIIAQKKILLLKAQAEDFYSIHKDRPFYNDLVKFMISGPVLVQVLEGEDAVSRNREVMGATNPAEAEVGTIRKQFAESLDARFVGKGKHLVYCCSRKRRQLQRQSHSTRISHRLFRVPAVDDLI